MVPSSISSHFGNPKMLDLWPILSKSPHLTAFEWSPLVNAALETNYESLSPQFHDDTPRTQTPDMMAVHIRRGDYETHCRNLAG